MRALAIDFETANSSRTSACAIGMVWVEEGRIARTEYRLIRPKVMDFGYYETRVHGITAGDVIGAPEFPEIFEIIGPYISTHLLLCHNSAFDVSVLRETASLYGIALPECESLCTLELARRVWPRLPNHRLDIVANHLGLAFRHHHAEDDAIAAAQIGLHSANLMGTRALREAAVRAGVAVKRHAPANPVASRPYDEGRSSARRNGAGSRGELVFEVAGRSGNYRVSANRQGGRLRAVCSCPAGRSRRLCRHVREIAAGETGALLSSNYEEVRDFARWCADAGGVEAALVRE